LLTVVHPLIQVRSQSNAYTLIQQIPAVEGWIDAAARGPKRFAVLGDWNRQLAKPGDPFWAETGDGDPSNADLSAKARHLPHENPNNRINC